MFPLQFVGALGRFDLGGSVSGGGRSSQAGALRLAISQALLSFLSEGEVGSMRQGGGCCGHDVQIFPELQVLEIKSWKQNVSQKCWCCGWSQK